ncbi:divalent-cation tolerance protein CutA [Candidatus Woesearchaeota archaeon]|nr:divalent-cation tolerance protein CutA [Candidatus Woesearchaeota archaeon]
MLLLSIPCKDKDEAKDIAKLLLGKRLIACAHIHLVESFYHWEGELQDDNEFILMCETIEKHYPTIQKVVETAHSYDIPCILRWGAEANPLFQRWVEKEVRHGKDGRKSKRR